MKGKYLITTDNWFIAPDGKSYRAAWGEVTVLTALQVLGVEPNRNSANWMVRVGTDENHIILAGCQIHYATTCPDKPHQGDTMQRYDNATEPTTRDNCIYIPGETEKGSNVNPVPFDDGSTVVDKVATAKTYEFLRTLAGLKMDSGGA